MTPEIQVWFGQFLVLRRAVYEPLHHTISEHGKDSKEARKQIKKLRKIVADWVRATYREYGGSCEELCYLEFDGAVLLCTIESGGQIECEIEHQPALMTCLEECSPGGGGG